MNCLDALRAGLEAATTTASRTSRTVRTAVEPSSGPARDRTLASRTPDGSAATEAGRGGARNSGTTLARAAVSNRTSDTAGTGSSGAATATGGSAAAAGEQRRTAYRIPRLPKPNSSKEPAAKKHKASNNNSRSDKQKKHKKTEKEKGREKEGGRKKAQKKKKKTRNSSSDSSSSESSESSSSDESIGSTSSKFRSVSEDSSSEEDRHKKKKRRKHKRMSKEDWEAGLELYPLEDRPMYLRSRHGTAGRMSLTNLLKTGELAAQ
jgi:hypothetical protein